MIKSKYKNEKKIVAIIQARQTSTRFPGKSLEKINNLSIIEIIVKRLKLSKFIKEIIVAIPDNKENKILFSLLRKSKIKVFKGSEEDVLTRYFEAAKKYKAEHIVRITGDCPIVDSKIVDSVINLYFNDNVDYCSNVNPATFPDGLDVEIFSFKTLSKLNKLTYDIKDREHVTSLINKKKNFFKISNFEFSKDLSDFNFTLDEKDDLVIIRKIFNFFYPKLYFSFKDIEKNMKKIFKNYRGSLLKRKRNQGYSLGTGQKLWSKAKLIIPGGNMLLSKRAELYLPKLWPSYFKKAKGCVVWDLDGKKYYDMTLMGIGTNILGYGNNEIDKAVKRTVELGNMSTLNCPEEVKLIEKLIKLHPWASMAKLTRSGGEANAVAIRIARSASNKDKVAICGYHGWHDWYMAANIKDKKNLNEHLLNGLPTGGVPKILKNTTFTFRYNKINELKDIISKNPDLGVVKMEVCRSQRPNISFLKKVRALTKRKKIILIFDECTSGFRENLGGMHMKYKIYPDMVILGKALGNGYAINCVLGNLKTMQHAKSSFISSTFWTERIGPTAALKTLEVMQKEKSWKKINIIGNKIIKEWKKISKKNNIKIKIEGIPSLCGFRFLSKHERELNTLFTQEMLKKGFLATNNIYVSTKHDNKVLRKYFVEFNRVFQSIKNLDTKEKILAKMETSTKENKFSRLN